MDRLVHLRGRETRVISPSEAYQRRTNQKPVHCEVSISEGARLGIIAGLCLMRCHCRAVLEQRHSGRRPKSPPAATTRASAGLARSVGYWDLRSSSAARLNAS